jgi:hypothetical protein
MNFSSAAKKVWKLLVNGKTKVMDVSRRATCNRKTKRENNTNKAKEKNKELVDRLVADVKQFRIDNHGEMERIGREIATCRITKILATQHLMNTMRDIEQCKSKLAERIPTNDDPVELPVWLQQANKKEKEVC